MTSLWLFSKPRGKVPESVRASLQKLTHVLDLSYMATEVIYARVPASIKEAVETYASDRMSLSSAVADLLERGLDTVAKGPATSELQARVAQLSAELETCRRALQEANLEVERYAEREKQRQAALIALGQRSGQPVGTCPSCQVPVTGNDLLVNGQCRNGHGVTSMLAGTTSDKGGLNQTDWLLLVGAIGLVLAIAYLQSKG